MVAALLRWLDAVSGSAASGLVSGWPGLDDDDVVAAVGRGPWAVGRGCGPWDVAVDVALTLTLAVSLAVTHIVINSHASHLGRITPHRSPSP